MTVQPEKDHGQDVEIQHGSVLGVFDTKADLDTFTSALVQAGLHEEKIAAIHGTDGVQILERLPPYFLGDGEGHDIQRMILELKQGRFGAKVEVKNRDEAGRVASIGKSSGGRAFSYFGLLVHEQLTA